jgi:hypothetical protein
MRKSGYDVDDAGDASNTEIGHVAYLPSRTNIAIRPRLHAESGGLPRGKLKLGKGTLAGAADGLSVRSVATAMPNQTSVAVREPRPQPCANRAAGIAPNEKDLARGERVEKRHSLPSSLSR